MEAESTITMTDFIAKNWLTMESEPTDGNPNIEPDDWGKGASHYVCTIRNHDGDTMTVPFSMGAALKNPPTLAEVLDCLASDAGSVETADDFEEWAQDLGFDPDSRKAERMYRVTVKQSEALRHFLGSDAYETLLYEVARL